MASVRSGDSLGAQAERLGARLDSGRAWREARPVLLVVGLYTAAGALAVTIAAALGRNPLVCDGWLGMRGIAASLVSLGLGLPLSAMTVSLTRELVRRADWAHALHIALRPAVHREDTALAAVAAASAAGEELLFRGLLVPLMGVCLSSLMFGLLHQIRGRARWGWMAWATVMGLLFGGVFAMTGSLAGPLVAHAVINHANLRFLRDNDPAVRTRSLGGLLRR